MPFSAAVIAIAMFANAGAEAPAKVKAGKPVANEDKLICRREVETGSLVRSTKICHTRKEWSEIANAGQRDAQTMRDRASAFRNE